MKLSELTKGQTARIKKISCSGSLKSKLIDMGVLKGERVQIVRIAPLGDPVEVLIKQYKLSLRKKDIEGIIVEEVQ
ncbi:iron transporter FeoA [Prosthecochloris marina]|uniref:Iron transporter FeoA n=1 Tax=Prosthecochloris marina TaxID=2017681 RepID=A0A317T2R0_9CHLB|nr:MULTISPECIES: ferrous iron transport protein A [Prosthecochloris]PWW81029.1 iron transporter FeoA [Prosthecochloris marina]UZJ39849.1 ferrous iron transport protein A [Prosthecochloris sp. SCSIO W1102]